MTDMQVQTPKQGKNVVREEEPTILLEPHQVEDSSDYKEGAMMSLCDLEEKNCPRAIRK